jgi:hypothetical protein
LLLVLVVLTQMVELRHLVRLPLQVADRVVCLAHTEAMEALAVEAVHSLEAVLVSLGKVPTVVQVDSLTVAVAVEQVL